MQSDIKEEWVNRCIDYKWLFEEQKNITNGYKELVQEYLQKLEKKDFEIARLNNMVSLLRVDHSI